MLDVPYIELTKALDALYCSLVPICSSSQQQWQHLPPTSVAYALIASIMSADDNKLDIVQGISLLPWEWNNIGAVFGNRKENNQCVAARCNFVVRKGFDEAEQTQYGNVIEGLGDVGFNLRAKQYAFHISASNLSYKQGG